MIELLGQAPPQTIDANHGEWISIVIAVCALWLAWETRGLRWATLDLLSATRRQIRLAMAPFMHVTIAKTSGWELITNNVSSTLATELYGFLYDDGNKHYLRTTHKAHSKPTDQDRYDIWSAALTEAETLQYLTEHEPGADKDVCSDVIAHHPSEYFGVMFYHDTENRLYATRRNFKVGPNNEIVLLTLRRYLVSPKRRQIKPWERFLGRIVSED